MTDRPARVLVVVVNDDIRSMIADVLRRESLEVDETGSLPTALQLLAESAFDMVLLDLRDRYGDHSLVWLNAKQDQIDTKRTPIGVLSNKPPTPDEKRTARGLGLVFFLPRPSSRSEDLDGLARTVRRAVDAKRSRERSVSTDDMPRTAATKTRESGSGSPGSNEETEPRRRNRGLEVSFSPLPERWEPPAHTPVPSEGRDDQVSELGRSNKVPSRGDLRDNSIAEILSSYYVHKTSGKLHLRQGSVRRKIFFLGGYPVFASSNHTSEALGHEFRRQGLLHSEDIARGLQHSRATGLRLGEALVDLGLITPTDLDRVLCDSIREKILRAFESRNGVYRFETVTRFGENELSFALSPARLVIDGLTRYGDDALVRRYLPSSPKDRVCLVESPLWESGDLELTEQELAITPHLEAGLSIEQIEHETGADATFVQRFLLALSVLGLIDFERSVRPDSEPPQAERRRITIVPKAEPKVPAGIDMRKEAERVASADHFARLGLGLDATGVQIHQAFRERVKPYQAEAVSALSGDEVALAAGIRQKLVEAYLVLADRSLRESYVQDVKVKGREEAARLAEARRKAGGVASSGADGVPTPSPDQPQIARPSTSDSLHAATKGSRELFLEAKATLKARKAQEAALAMREALKQEPDHARLLAWAGWTLFWANPATSAGSAMSYLKQSIERDASHPEAFVFMARILVHQGKLDEALSHYQQVLKKQNVPPTIVTEVRTFQDRLEQGRIEARTTGHKLADVIERDEKALFKRWVLDE
jgi:CheY-like chemotaxis protein/tetratricopeptide (TPR) repeat protein